MRFVRIRVSVCAGCVTVTLSSPSRTPARSTAEPSVSATTTPATTSRDNFVEVGVTLNNILIHSHSDIK